MITHQGQMLALVGLLVLPLDSVRWGRLAFGHGTCGTWTLGEYCPRISFIPTTSCTVTALRSASWHIERVKHCISSDVMHEYPTRDISLRHHLITSSTSGRLGCLESAIFLM
ncbi:hypothetical protein B0F90DRAFT_708616 [Multifurca ochricompacta]|uniref:Secreted protein n=1 Tax=Multifurca ochricompacta TaxID=376703 RepID=A0AAD4M1U5_9AGAM|nr:hypothetical protein B0F90DRAFT_708616 [Multifurca ochricompacta]